MRKLVWTVLCLGTVPLQAQDLELWDLTAPRVVVRLNAGLVHDIGIALTGPAGSPSRDGYVAYELGGEGRMVAVAPGSIFRTVGTGELRLTSGPGLAWSGGETAMVGARLQPGTEPRSFTITAADGSPLFFADHQHHAVDRQARGLRLFNLDLHLSAALAERLGNPAYAGLTVGGLEIRMKASIPRGAVERPFGGCITPNWGRPDNDVALIALPNVQQVARDENSGIVAIAPSAMLKNVGLTDVPWNTKFTAPTPPYDNDQHPFLVWNMYRVANNGALEQIGASGMKHAFFTVNSACACAGGHILWVNCEDTYSFVNNDSSLDIGHRSEVTAHNGAWKRCGSLFDANCDGVQDNPIPPFNGPTDKRRLTVLERDLQTGGAVYYFEGWYVVRDDTNIFNTMGYRTVTPSFGGAIWTFGPMGGFVSGPVIDAWVNPTNPGPNADHRRVTADEGHLTLAVRAIDLGSGLWRYDYALMNHDFDRKIRSFTVPLPAGALAGNATFHDVDRDATTDWVATVTPGAHVVWNAPANNPGPVAAALDWGLLDNFSFVTDAPPSAAQGVTAKLGIAGQPLRSISVSILGPSAP